MAYEMKHSGGSVGSWVSVTQEILQRFIADFFPTEIKTTVSVGIKIRYNN